jgi:hypothetical protein
MSKSYTEIKCWEVENIFRLQDERKHGVSRHLRGRHRVAPGPVRQIHQGQASSRPKRTTNDNGKELNITSKRI